jgi:hypothetical protein
MAMKNDPAGAGSQFDFFARYWGFVVHAKGRTPSASPRNAMYCVATRVTGPAVLAAGPAVSGV